MPAGEFIALRTQPRDDALGIHKGFGAAEGCE